MHKYYADCINNLNEPILIVVKDVSLEAARSKLIEQYRFRKLLLIDDKPRVKPRASIYKCSTTVVGAPINSGRKHTTSSTMME